MGIDFWISQILGIIALVMVCLSYNYNDKKKFLAFQILSNIFYAGSFLALGVLVGGVNTLIALVRVTVLYCYERKGKSPPIYIFLIFFLLYIGSGILCYQRLLDLIAIVCYQIFNLAMFVKNIRLTRLIMLPPNFMIMAYNIILSTFTNAILDIVEIVMLIVAIYRFSNYNQMRKGRFIY
jgi:hypothetical protein